MKKENEKCRCCNGSLYNNDEIVKKFNKNIKLKENQLFIVFNSSKVGLIDNCATFNKSLKLIEPIEHKHWNMTLETLNN